MTIAQPPGRTRTHTLDNYIITIADNIIDRTIGLRWQPVPDNHALIIPYDHRRKRVGIDMFAVRTPLDVLWLEDGVVTTKETLRPWWGTAAHPADTVIELPGGDADDITEGDTIHWHQ